MNTKLIFPILIFCIFFSRIAVAKQAYSATPETGIMNFVSSSTPIDNSETKGSPYLEEEFLNGEVIINDKVELTGKMRYNAYRNEIEVLDNRKEDSYFPLLKRSYIKVNIGDKPYNIHTFEGQNGGLRTSYFVELNQGSTILLFKPEAKLRKGRVASTSYDRNVPPTYVWANSYYILKNTKDGEDYAEKIKLSKKNILPFLADKKQQIEKYIGENKLKLRKQDDVVDLLNYYNSL